MVKLTCPCLNVKIHTKNDPKALAPAEHDMLMKACANDVVKNFVKNPVNEVTLNLEGIHIEHPRLVINYTAANWKVYRCENCGICSHALLVGGDEGRVLASSLLLNSQKSIELMSSIDYSPVYKIVLQGGSVDTSVSLDSMSPELRNELEVVQKQLNAFLVSEESAMEERIRLYMQSERDQYALLQSRARSHKNILMSRFLAAGCSATESVSLSDALKDTSITNSMPPSSVWADSSLDDPLTMTAKASPGQCQSPVDVISFEEDQQDDVLSPLPTKSVSRSNSNTVKKRQSSSGPSVDPHSVTVSKNLQPEHIPIDDVFQFDPGFQEDPNIPFSDSDDEVVDTDDSSQIDDGIQRGGRSAQDITSRNPQTSSNSKAVSGFSTSVPIDVPVWIGGGSGQAPDNQYYCDDADDQLPQNAESMAASIKALARSVHGNTSEIFGELPEPPTRARVASTSISGRR